MARALERSAASFGSANTSTFFHVLISFFSSSPCASNFNTSINVNPLPWIPQFTCPSTCTKNLTYTPTETGAQKITFDIRLPDYKIQTTKDLIIDVSDAPAQQQDLAIIQGSILALEARLKELEISGIHVPPAKAILDKAKTESPKTPADVARILGDLDEARSYLDFAEDTILPRKRELPLTEIVVGLIALVVGLGIVWFVFFKRQGLPPQAP